MRATFFLGTTVTHPSSTLLIRGGGLVSRLAAALAQRERPPETVLDLRHKTRRTERPADQHGGFALEQVGDSPHEGLQRLRDFQMTEIRVSPCGG